MRKLWLTAPFAAALLAAACHTGSRSLHLAFSERETQVPGTDYARPVHYAHDMTEIDAATGDDAAWAKSYAMRPTPVRPSTPPGSIVVVPDSEEATAASDSPTIPPPEPIENASAETAAQPSDMSMVEGQN